MKIRDRELSIPIIQGGMGVGISLSGLAGAVAACGGMGVISAAHPGYRDPDFYRDPLNVNRRCLKEEIAKAKEIALAEVPGGTVFKCQLDRDDGRLVYEVEVYSGTTEYDFEIDAQTGSILSRDVDYRDR